MGNEQAVETLLGNLFAMSKLLLFRIAITTRLRGLAHPEFHTRTKVKCEISRMSTNTMEYVHFRLSTLVYKSLRKTSVDHGSLVRFVNPAKFSQVFLPLIGPGAGILTPSLLYILPESFPTSAPLLTFLSSPVNAPLPASTSGLDGVVSTDFALSCRAVRRATVLSGVRSS